MSAEVNQAEDSVGNLKYTLGESPNVKWEEICGLEEAKLQMREAIELPHQNPEIFAYYNKKPPKGILLYGDPGCGKTMLGKAAATSLAAIYGEESLQTSFIYLKGSEVLNKYVGESEKNVRELFKRAKAHKKKHKYPAIIFIDEADGLLGVRGGKANQASVATTSMTVPTFLAEMDGMEDSGAFIILATNRPDALDPAITRDGRIDRKIKITRPSQKDAIEIFKLTMKNTPMFEGESIINLAKFIAVEVYSDERTYYEVHKSDDEYDYFRMRDIVNGAMLVNIVDYGTSLAIRRDLNDKKRTGLSQADMKQAIDYIFAQNRDVNHDDALQSMVLPYREDVISITKIAA